MCLNSCEHCTSLQCICNAPLPAKSEVLCHCSRQAQKGVAKGKAKVATADSDSDDGLEAEYERAPRQRLQEKEDKQKAILPTKSLRGELVYAKTKQGDSSMPDMQVCNCFPYFPFESLLLPCREATRAMPLVLCLTSMCTNSINVLSF